MKGWTQLPRADLDQCLQWVKQGYNIGMRTGEASGGIVVIDVDEGGDIGGLNLPKTVTAITGGGGRHFFFRSDKPLRTLLAGWRRRSTCEAMAAKLCSPARFILKRDIYEWLPGHSPADLNIVPLPPSIFRKLTASKPAQLKRQTDGVLREKDAGMTIFSGLAWPCAARGVTRVRYWLHWKTKTRCGVRRDCQTMTYESLP